MSFLNEKRLGFTLIELLVVVAIIATLTGIAVPYYNDYITDARRSTLKQNVANFRKVIGDFRADQGRGPFRVPVASASVYYLVNPRSATDSELVAGPIQVVRTSGGDITVQRRTGLKYIPTIPVLEDPVTTERLSWDYGTATLFFVDDDSVEGQFDFNKDFAFVDDNANMQFDGAAVDTVLYNFGSNPPEVYIGSNAQPLDYIDIIVTDSQGMAY